MHPNESVQAHIDLKGERMLPIHNGTFDLALHDWKEPFDLVTSNAKDKQVNLLTPTFGEILKVKSPKFTDAWWQKLVPTGELALAAE